MGRQREEDAIDANINCDAKRFFVGTPRFAMALSDASCETGLPGAARPANDLTLGFSLGLDPFLKAEALILRKCALPRVQRAMLASTRGTCCRGRRSTPGPVGMPSASELRRCS